jgi:hypothetical protein
MLIFLLGLVQRHFELLCVAPLHAHLIVLWWWAFINGGHIQHLANAAKPRLLGYTLEGLCFRERLSVVSFRLLTLCDRRALLHYRAYFCFGCTSGNIIAMT